MITNIIMLTKCNQIRLLCFHGGRYNFNQNSNKRSNYFCTNMRWDAIHIILKRTFIKNKIECQFRLIRNYDWNSMFSFFLFFRISSLIIFIIESGGIEICLLIVVHVGENLQFWFETLVKWNHFYFIMKSCKIWIVH